MNYFKRGPTPLPEIERELCRVLPFFIADNFDYFDLMPAPKTIKNVENYVINFRKKIVCMKEEFLL